jgi:hypothetical protein
MSGSVADDLGRGALGVGIGFALYLLVSNLGLGGRGGSRGDQVPAPPAPVPPRPSRCTIRIDSAGIFVDGKVMTPAQVVKACEGIPVVELVVTGGARQGDLDEVEGALRSAGITFKRREQQPTPAAHVVGASRGQYGRGWRLW